MARASGLGGLLAGAVLLASVAAALAGPPTDQVRQYTDHVQGILDDTSLDHGDKRAAVRKVAAEAFDLTEMAKRALGRHWQGRTAAEQEEFVQVFADLLERAYVAKIDFYGGERLQFTGETIDGDYAVVRAKVITRQRSEIPIDARLLRRDNRWLIYDIVIESVSLVGNYRSQFDRIIRSYSYEELIRRLKSRRDESSGPAPSLAAAPVSSV